MPSVWTLVPKPTETVVVGTNADAEPWGMLLAITSVRGHPASSVITGWGEVPKPTSSVWSIVAKPTS